MPDVPEVAPAHAAALSVGRTVLHVRRDGHERQDEPHQLAHRQRARAAGKHVLLETTLGYRLDDETLDVPRTLGGYLQAFEKAAKMQERWTRWRR